MTKPSTDDKIADNLHEVKGAIKHKAVRHFIFVALSSDWGRMADIDARRINSKWSRKGKNLDWDRASTEQHSVIGRHKIASCPYH